MRLMAAGGYLLMGGGSLILASATLLGSSAVIGQGPSALPSASPSSAPSASATPVSQDGCGDTVRYATVRDKDKDFRYALADPASADQDATFENLTDAVYEDPIRAAAAVAVTDRALEDINNRPPNYASDKTVWCEQTSSALGKLRTATFTVEDVDAGSWTLVAVPEKGLDGDVPATIYQQKIADGGKAAVYRFNTYTVKFLLDGGFSPVRSSKFDDIDVVPKAAKPSASASALPSANPTPSPSGSSTGVGPGTVDHDPHHNGGADQGGGTNTGLQGGASAPSGSPPAARRTNPPAPVRTSAASGSSGSTGSSSASSPSPSPTPSATRTVPPPEASAPSSSSPETGCVDPFNMGVCD